MGYPTDLTDKQWQFIEKMLDDKDRKRKHSLRSILNGIFYLVKTGCQWRMLPSNFAPWNTVYYYYRKWKNNVFQRKFMSSCVIPCVNSMDAIEVLVLV